MDQEAHLCSGYTRIQRAYYDYALPIVFSLGLLSMLPAICSFIAAFVQHRLHATASAFYLGIFYYLVYILFSICIIISYIARCHTHSSQSAYTADFIAHYLYFLQFLLFTIILFYRLVSIFADTAFAVSRLRITIYTVLICISLSLSTCGFTLFNKSPNALWSSLGYLMWGSGGSIGIGIMVWLNIMFVRKLINVVRECNRKEDELMTIATKTSLLCFIGTGMTIMCITFVMTLNAIDPTHRSIHPNLMLFRELAVFADLYTNFLTVLLSFCYFDDWYFKLCGCCHRRLKLCCYLSTKQQNMQMMVYGVASMSSSGPETSPTPNPSTTTGPELL